MTDLGTTVAKYRGFRGYSQETLATEVGITRGAIAQIELGQIEWPRVNIIQQVALALCVPLETLLQEYGIIGNGREDGEAIAALVHACPDMKTLFDLVREHTGNLPEIIRIVQAVIGSSPAQKTE